MTEVPTALLHMVNKSSETFGLQGYTGFWVGLGQGFVAKAKLGLRTPLRPSFASTTTVAPGWHGHPVGFCWTKIHWTSIFQVDMIEFDVVFDK